MFASKYWREQQRTVAQRVFERNILLSNRLGHLQLAYPYQPVLPSESVQLSDHNMAEAEPSRSIVTLDVAKSNRSTCKATGEKIEKGEHRVGVEAYSGGHISMTWQVYMQCLTLASVAV